MDVCYLLVDRQKITFFTLLLSPCMSVWLGNLGHLSKRGWWGQNFIETKSEALTFKGFFGGIPLTHLQFSFTAEVTKMQLSCWLDLKMYRIKGRHYNYFYYCFIIMGFKTRTTIIVSNGRYTFYQILFIEYTLSNAIYQILFIK